MAVGDATFDEALSTVKDWIRARIGDTNGLTGSSTPQTVTKAWLKDATISALATALGATTTDHYEAAAQCAEMVCAIYAHKPSTVNLNLHLGAERFAQLKTLARELRAQKSAAATGRASFDVGGRLVSEKTTVQEDSTLVQSVFKKGQDDNPLGSGVLDPFSDDDD